MVDMPAKIPVTKPALLTDAVKGLELVHALLVAAVPDPVNCVCAPFQTERTPVIIGSAFTVITAF